MSESGSTLLRRSPLQGLHESAGATFTEFSGWRLPLRFTSEVAEHLAVRSSVGLFDISHMAQMTFNGESAGEALAAAVVSDVSTMTIGRARYTMMCDTSGGVIDDLIIYRLGERDWFVIANAANAEAVFAGFAPHAAARDVKAQTVTEGRALIAVQGPDAAGVVASCLGGPEALPRRFHVAQVEIEGHQLLLARTGYTGEDGFELSVGRDGAIALWRRLMRGGGGAVPVPVGLSARDSLRLEAGLPLYGHELDLDHSPFEAGFGRVVDLDHTFVGAEALRAASAAPPRVNLVGIVCEGRRVPRQGYTVRDQDGSTVGVVTSGAPSPSLGEPIAMAYVATGRAQPGTALGVEVRGRTEASRVVELPFVRRSNPGQTP